jgi:PAS domain S-box-containing protein
MSDHAKLDVLERLDEGQRALLLLDAVKDYAVYMLDAGGRVATWNTGAQLFKGYAAEEIVGSHFSVFYTEEDRAAGAPERALATAMAEGRFEAEGWRVRKDGTRFWTHAVIDPVIAQDGQLIGYAKITRDVSQRRATNQALYESEQRFQRLVQGVHDYAIYMLDPTGHVTNWNSGAQAIKGYTSGEIVGRHFSLFYTPEDRENGMPERALATALEDGKFEGEAQRVRKGGERFWAHVVIDPIRDEAGNLVGFAKITRDVTEKRAAQEEIDKAREALVQAQKMEAIGRLTGGVAHDFNNLLTVIRASADFLRRKDLSEDKRAQYVEAIATTSERAAALTGQLLAFARRQPLRPELFDIGQRLRGLEHIISTTVGSAIDYRLSPVDEALLVAADVTQFETAILNMVVNARDAMPRGGRLGISASHVDGVPTVRGHAAAKGDFIRVVVEDSGAGMDRETVLRVFEPFFTTKDVDKGTGLGLSQVYGFAKQSHGEIDVVSAPGKGSAFALYLPRAAGEPQARAPLPRIAKPLAPRRVLLVEDNETVGGFARDLLSELGQRVTWVGDAQSALDLLQQGADRFDIIFTDVVMPGLSGIELAQRVAQAWPGIRVVLTSGYSHVLAQDGALGLPLLTKPYSIDQLVTALAELDEAGGDAAQGLP